MLRKEIHGNELYLFNEKNEVIFKRWINHGYSKWFTPWAYDKHTYVSITDNGIVYNQDRQNEKNG